MKKIFSILLAVVLCFAAAEALVSCKDKEPIDYVAQWKLDLNSSTAKMEVTVKNYVDGDTTHFFVPGAMASEFANGVLKARYLAVDTPESTGAIEPYGQQASDFTHEKLASAESIMLESEDENWNTDANGRHLVWIWYRPAKDAEYRLLNLELLQTGLAKGKNVDGLRYTEICTLAYNQAIDFKLKVYSNEEDPKYYYGDAIETDIKYLRTHIDEVNGKRVAFTGTIVKEASANQAVYVQSYDAEDDMYYGMYVYYGYALKFGISQLKLGNSVHFVGVAKDNATYGFQISDIKYDPYQIGTDEEKDFFKVISTDNEVIYKETSVSEFNGKKTIELSIDGELVKKEYSYAQLALKTAVSFKNLKVVDIFTTSKEDSSSKGAMTLTCKDAANNTLYIRTVVLYEDDNANNPVVTAEKYLNKTIDVKGFVDFYQPESGNGQYQIKVYQTADIIVK